MIVAIDTNCILPGQVGGIENYTVGLVEALRLPRSPAQRLLLLTRPENHELFSGFADARTRVLLLDRPLYNGAVVENWAELLKNDPLNGRRALVEFQHAKANLLRKHGADLVHFPGNTINPLDLDWPIVLNLHDLQHRHFPQYFSEEELAQREKWWTPSALRADALLAASKFVRDDLQRQLGVDRSRIFVAPDAFQSAFFAEPDRARLIDLRQRFKLPAKFFIYPAAVWPHKNHPRLIRAFVQAQIPDAQLLLCGGGQEDSDLPRLIAKLGATGHVRLLGRVSTEDLLGLYHLATALVFPSEFEAWSIPVMEAMACGCPVASSNVTSLPEEIADAGVLFDPTDIGSIAASMRILALDDSLRQILSRRGKSRVRSFSPENLLKTLTEAYEFALRAHREKKAA
jgi:glycosyltransferase involved in cell wall biosynthesis